MQEKDLLVCDHFFQILKKLQIGFGHADVGGEFFAVRFCNLKFDDHVFLNAMFVDRTPESREFRVVSGKGLPGVFELQKHHWVYTQNIFLFYKIVFQVVTQRVGWTPIPLFAQGTNSNMLMDSSIKYLSRNCKIWEEYATISTEKVVTVYGSKFSELKIPYNTVVMVNFVDLKCEASEKRWSGSYKGEVRCWRTQKNGWQKMSFVI